MLNESDVVDPRSKRSRAHSTITAVQYVALLKKFNESPFITKEQAIILGEEIGLAPKKIVNWFPNRRQKLLNPKRPVPTRLLESQWRRQKFKIKRGSHKHKIRNLLTSSQYNTLLEMFDESPFIATIQSDNLAKEFGLNSIKIQRWFMNRRQLEKRKHGKT